MTYHVRLLPHGASDDKNDKQTVWHPDTRAAERVCGSNDR